MHSRLQGECVTAQNNDRAQQKLAQQRTGWAHERTQMAALRTYFALLRTGQASSRTGNSPTLVSPLSQLAQVFGDIRERSATTACKGHLAYSFGHA